MDVYADARARGLVADFFDARGEHRVTRPDALRAILDALPSQPARRFCHGASVLRHGRDDFVVSLADDMHGLDWRLTLDGRLVAEGTIGGRTIALPSNLAIGAYHLELRDTARDAIECALVLVAPERAETGSFERVWLMTTQLYSLTSARNWGIGDFTDLAQLIEIAAPLGCAGI